MRKGFLSVCAVLGFVAFARGAVAAPLFKPGQAVVKFKARSALSLAMQASALQGTLGKKYATTVRPFQTDKSYALVKVENEVAIGQLLADIRATGQVEYAEPNFIYHALDDAPVDPKALIPNDPGFGNNWGLLNTGQKDSKGQVGTAGSDIGATKAWDLGTGSKDIKVAIIDTGVDYTHDEIKNNYLINTGEVAGNGKDDDGNGFIDDVYGWNFEGKNNDPKDDHKHGTHCAGTIGAEGNNGIGTAGVNWHVSILGVKFLSASGSGTLDDAVEAIKYATLRGVNIMSNSWGGGGFSQTMFDAIKAAKDKGILFVAAAGNESNNNDASASYPATYQIDNVVSVAATDNRDQKAPWSNWGNRTVHLGAPGVNIYSTVIGNTYDTFSGTSMACPHVSGAAALLWSLNRNMTYAEIKARLMNTADPVRSLKRKTVTGGRLNVYNAIKNIVPEKNEPPADRWKAVARAEQSKHPYEMNANQTFEIAHSGAKFMRLHFSKLSTEAGYDIVTIKNQAGEVIEELSGDLGEYTTDYIDGAKVTVSFVSDGSVDGFGFALDRYDFID